MDNGDLAQKKCKPCEGGVSPMSDSQSDTVLKNLVGWQRREKRIYKTFEFQNFVKAMRFVNQVAEIAEAEGHHPDLHIHYNQVRLELWTHAIGGLSENDFIVAAKTDALV